MGLFLNVLLKGLSLWDDKEKHKYIDRVLGLKKDYDAEQDKPVGERDNSVMDRIDRELRDIGDVFSSDIVSASAGSGPS